jgi:hypothetical protein
VAPAPVTPVGMPEEGAAVADTHPTAAVVPVSVTAATVTARARGASN